MADRPKDRDVYQEAFVRLATAGISFEEALPTSAHGDLVSALVEQGFSVNLGKPSARSGLAPPLAEGLLGADHVAIASESISITTAEYGWWERFHERVVDLLSATAAKRAVTAVSLWYMNEIQPPEDVGPDGWATYVNLPVPTPLDFGDVGSMFGGLLLCPHRSGDHDAHEAPNHRHVSVEWAHTRQGAISPDDPLYEYYDQCESAVLALELVTSEPFVEHLSESEAALELVTQHGAIKAVFERVLTERSRKLMGTRRS